MKNKIIVLCALCWWLTLPTLTAQVNLNNGLVAHYPFNGNANDVSGNGNHGTEYGGLVYGTDRFGNGNSAGVFDGIDDYIDLGDKTDFQFGTSDFTIGLWFWFDGNPQVDGKIISKQMSQPPWEQYSIAINGNSIGSSSGKRILAFLKPQNSNSNRNNLSSDLSAGWHFITMINDYDDKMMLYIDGAFIGSNNTNFTGNLDINGYPLWIGKKYASLSNFFFNGKIDDIRIYNRAINPTEVQVLYQEGINLNNGLVAHYPLNGNADDVSGNGHDGIEYGGLVYGTDRFGNGNSAGDFDGIDDYIDIGNTVGNGIRSISLWFSPNITYNSTYPAHTTLITRNDGSSATTEFAFTINQLSLYDGAITFSRGENGVYKVVHSNSNLWNQFTWYHVTGVIDPINGMSIYINGVKQTSTDPSTIATHTDPEMTTIGARASNLTRFFNGKIDDIRIYNRALTLPEIQALYNQNSSAPYNYCFGDAAGNPISVGCNANTFTVPLWVDGDMTTGIIGLDFCMNYDPTIMTPTGNAYFGSVVSDPTNGLYLVNANNGTVNVSISNTGFSGTGKIIEVEFTLNAGASLGNYPITHCAMDSLIESFATYDIDLPISSSSIEVTHEPMNGRVIYHNDGSQPIINDLTQATSPTLNIHAIDGQNNCNSLQTVTPDANGYFDLHFPATATGMRLERDIPNSNSVLGVINGADVTETFYNIISNGGNPTVYQLIAADVNNSGRVTAGDLTLMIQRNDLNGTGEFADADDWYFIHNDTLQTTPYQNAHKNAVPIPSTCLDIPDLQSGSSCVHFSGTEIFHAVLKGDVNRTWTTGNDAQWRSGDLSADSLIFEMPPMDLGNDRYKIPFRYVSQNSITSLDGRITIDPTLISIDTFYMAAALQQIPQKLFDYSHNTTELVFNTALLSGALTTPDIVYYLEVTDLTGVWQNNGILCSEAYFNGTALNVGACTTPTLPVLMDSDINSIAIFPNPTTDNITIDYHLNMEQVDNIELYDVQGQVVKVVRVNEWGVTELSLKGLSTGLYVVKVQMKSGKVVGRKIVFSNEE